MRSSSPYCEKLIPCVCLINDLIFYLGYIFLRVGASHWHLVGRHLPLQVVDIDLRSKSDIYFIVVTSICIDYSGFSNKIEFAYNYYNLSIGPMFTVCQYIYISTET